MNRKGVGMLVVGLVLIAVFLSGFFVKQSNQQIQQPNKLQASTSFYPLYFMSEQIGGEKAQVRNITPAGAEPHDYEPTAQDIVSIENSDLLVLNGGGLEVWGEDIKHNIDLNRTLIINAGEGLTTQSVVEDGEEIVDPHIWLSPVLMKQMVDKITLGFTKADASNADYYEANARTLKVKLDILDTKFRIGLNSCSQRSIITSHAAFGYLATTYGLKQIAITGISPDAEPSPQQLKEVADFARKNNVKYIFFESLVSPKLAQTIAREVGAQTLVLNPLEGLSKNEISAGENYITVMENNLANLRIALQCK